MKKLLHKKFKNIQYKWARTSPKRYLNYLRKIGVKIGENVTFHGKLSTISIDLTRPSLITIGDNVNFNGNFNLFTHDWGTFVIRNYYKDFVPSSGRVKIGNNVVFGRNVTILKGVTIGDNCLIGAGSIITKSVPSNSVALGVPAKVVTSLDEYYLKRKERCLEEALDYARSIQERFGRRPVIEDFWEEFPLFLNGDVNCARLPIKKQLGPAYGYYRQMHKSTYQSFDQFLNAAGI